MKTMSQLAGFAGTLIRPGDSGYDAARQVWNGAIDRRPALIARCADENDAARALAHALDEDLPVSIRGGGHNIAGSAVADGGVVVDFSALHGVEVDSDRRTARAQPGALWGDFDGATQLHGLATPGGLVTHTGVAGLTLGGGSGHLTREFGLTIDNLLEADVVLADGSFVTASKTGNADLLWALSGGGGNFGVVTSFLFQAHPVSMVFAGPIAWEQSHARMIMRAYREFLPKAPEELGVFVGLKMLPATAPFPKEFWGARICLLVPCYNGPEKDGKKALAPLLDALPAPALNWMSMMPYPALQSMFDGLYPKGMQWYWRGDFVKELSDSAIDVHIDQAAKTPSELSLMHLYPIDGAVHRVGKDKAAWSARDATWSMVIAGIDPNPQKAELVRRWTKAYWEALHPYNLGGGYVNFMMDDEGDARVKATYGDNYNRLAALKKKYDPANLFRVNQNIRPAA
jgi:FAD/FMN-containing dehydrogenase